MALRWRAETTELVRARIEYAIDCLNRTQANLARAIEGCAKLTRERRPCSQGHRPEARNGTTSLAMTG
ncbi:hypothetical protein [Blastomonas natatoria]|uniref:hypothetical protein n=1 Tax=Blastomonas natatoria TaxID=34015 RepID=UPI000D76D01A|nr:hypothetical protein [Blastomonas natatoria]